METTALGFPFGGGFLEFLVSGVLNTRNRNGIDASRRLLGAPALGSGLLSFGKRRFETVDLRVQPALFGPPSFGGGFQFFFGLLLLTPRLLELGFIFGLNFLCHLLSHGLFIHSGGL